MATVAVLNAKATAWAGLCQRAALYTTTPTTTSQGIEVVGGSYARVAVSWSAPAGGVTSATAVFDVPAGVALAGVGLHGADGAYRDGAVISVPEFAAAGQLVVTLTYTES